MIGPSGRGRRILLRVGVSVARDHHDGCLRVDRHRETDRFGFPAAVCSNVLRVQTAKAAKQSVKLAARRSAQVCKAQAVESASTVSARALLTVLISR